MGVDNLRRLLTDHFIPDGQFSPFTYCVGLETSFEEAEDSIQSYPLPAPVEPEVLDRFLKSLTLFHELAHLTQFLTTSYGLRVLRYTLICLKNLSRRPGWRLPLAHSLAGALKSRPREEVIATEGFLIFVDALNQLRLDTYGGAPPSGGTESCEIDSVPWSPHFLLLEDQSPASREQFARHLRSIGAHVRSIPRIRFVRSGTEFQITLNVAALMECFAVLTEMNHLHNAMPDVGLANTFELLPPGNEYHAVAAYFLDRGYCDLRTLMPTLNVCVDAALMYDPFVLFNVPWDAVDENGRADGYPGETFVRICDATRAVEPIQDATPAETARFYRAICAEAGLPDPEWMALRSHEVAARLFASAPPEALLRKALKAHADALEYRVKTGAASFPFVLPTTAVLHDVLGLAVPVVSFYDLNTGRPDQFDPRKVDVASIHSILYQAFVSSTIDCPLKTGNPFFCDSAHLPPSKLCVWKHQFGTSECLVDMLERSFGLVPGEE